MRVFALMRPFIGAYGYRCAYGLPVRRCISAPIVRRCCSAPINQFKGGLWAKHRTAFLTFFRVWIPTYCQAYKSAKNVVLIDPEGFSNGSKANIAPIKKAKGIKFVIKKRIYSRDYCKYSLFFRPFWSFRPHLTLDPSLKPTFLQKS